MKKEEPNWGPFRTDGGSEGLLDEGLVGRSVVYC